MLPACDKTRDMRHVDHEQRAVFVRDLGKCLKINGSGIGGRTGHKQLRPVPANHVLDLIIVDAARLRVHAVADAVIVFAGEIDAGAVRQMAAAGKIHAHERIARLQERGIDLQIGLRAGVRLYIGIGRAEQLFRALDRDRLQHIHIIAAAVIALAGVTLGVFVRQNGAHGCNDGGRGDVLRRDQFNVLLLALKFVFDAGRDLGVLRLQIVHAGFKYVCHDDVSPYTTIKMSRPSPVCSLWCRITKAVAAALSFCLRDSACALHLRHSIQ